MLCVTEAKACKNDCWPDRGGRKGGFLKTSRGRKEKLVLHNGKGAIWKNKFPSASRFLWFYDLKGNCLYLLEILLSGNNINTQYKKYCFITVLLRIVWTWIEIETEPFIQFQSFQKWVMRNWTSMMTSDTEEKKQFAVPWWNPAKLYLISDVSMTQVVSMHYYFFFFLTCSATDWKVLILESKTFAASKSGTH